MISIQSSLIHNKIAGLGKQLKHGDFVVLKVISGSGKSYQISINGTLLPVKSDLKLKVGDILRVRIIKTEDKLEFKLVDPSKKGIPAGFSGFDSGGLQDEKGAEKILKAFLRSGLPLNPELLNKLPTTVKRKAGENDTTARLLSLLLKKGITPTETGLSALYSLMDQGNTRGEHHHRREGQERPEDGKKLKPGEIEKSLKGQWTAGNKENPLHLFNHISSSDGHWMLLPFALGEGEGRLEGTLSVFIRKGSSVPETACIRCFQGGKGLDFFLRWNGDGSGRHILLTETEDGTAPPFEEKKWLKFKEKLQNLGVKLVDTNKDGAVFDGFSVETEIPVRTGIERFG